MSDCDIFSMVDEWVRFLPPSPDQAQIRGWAIRFAEVVVDRTSRKMEEATAKALKIAGALLCDPEYQANLKKRRADRKRERAKRGIQRSQEIAKQEASPHSEQIARQLQRTEQHLGYHKAQVFELQAKISELKQLQISNSNIKQQMN